MAQQWTARDLPSLAGKRAIVTGANRGLGLETAAGLAGAGAEVTLACRDPARAESAINTLRTRVPNVQLTAMTLDLADLASIRRFADDYATRHPHLDLLCNNASAIMLPLQRTRDGFEAHIGTNHLGPFALTGLLLKQLQAAPAARVINTASLAHRLNKGLDLDDLHFARTPYKEMEAYGRSKLATLLFTYELDRRLKRAGSPVIAAAAHPGYTATNLDIGGFFLRLSTRLFAQPVESGARPALYAAGAAGVQGNDYFGPGGLKELRGPPVRVSRRDEAQDPLAAERLWALSSELTGVDYLPPP